METEETKFINDEKKQTVDNVTSNKDISEKKKSSKASNMAFGAGGFVAGAAAMATAQAAAANANLKDGHEGGHEEITATAETTPENSENSTTTETASHNAPNQEDVILATDEGIRVAQVDDNQSFASAFADARAQVGPGGVFEWHGKVYGTYYKEEWDAMSAGERHEYQSKIDYQDITSGPTSTAQVDSHPTGIENTVSSTSYEQNDETQSDMEVKVLGIEEMQDGEGGTMTVAGVLMDGQEVLLVDVDQDGKVDLAMADLNGDGQISDDEITDISSSDIHVSDLQQQLAGDNGVFLANDDSMPDYMNDANVNNYMG